MTNNRNKSNQENSQRRRANQPAVPPSTCTTTTTAAPTVTVFIPPFHQAAIARHVHQQQQQSMDHATVYEDSTPIMNLQGDVDVNMVQRTDIGDDQVPHLTPPSRFDGKFGRPTAEKAVFTTPPNVILSPSASASLAYKKYPTVFNRPFDMNENRPLDSTAAGSSSSVYQAAAAQCGTVARQDGGQAGSCPHPVSQEEIAPCLDIDQQLQWQHQDYPTPYQSQASSSMSSSSTTSNWPYMHLFGPTGLGLGTPEPAKGFLSPSADSNGKLGYKPIGPSFSHLAYNSNTGFGNCSSLPSSCSSALPTPAPGATSAPVFGQPSFPASVTQISALTPSRPLVHIPFGSLLKSPFLPRSATDLHYKQQQFQRQEDSQTMNANTPSLYSFVNQSNDTTVTTTLSDALRCPELSDALQRTIRKRLDRIRQEIERQDRHRFRVVQKRRRRRCMTGTDSGREETNYSDDDRCCQSQPRPLERRRRSSLPTHGGQSRKDRRMARRAVKELQYFRNLKAKCRKMLSEMELNEREHHPLIRTSALMATLPPSLPSASDIRAYQEYRALHVNIDYDKIHHDPEEMRKYQELARMGRIFLREKSSSELALLEEMAMGGVASAENGRTTVFGSGLTAAEWVEAQGWMFSPSIDPLMVFTMHASDQPAGDNEKSGTVADTNCDPSTATGNNTATAQSTEPSSQPAASTANTTSTSTRTSSLWRFFGSVAPPSIIPSRSAAATTTTAPAEATASTISTSTTASPSITPLRQSPCTNTNTSPSTSLTQTPTEIPTPPQQRRRSRSQTRRPEFKTNLQARYFSQDEESDRVAATSPGGSHAVVGPPADEPLIDNERTNRNKAFRGVAEVRRQEDAALRDEEAQEAALKRAQRRVMRAQVRREEEDALLAEEVREQEEWDRRSREVNPVQPLDPVSEEARKQWILDQLEKRRIRDECLDDELRQLMELERQRDEVERMKLMEQSRMEDEREKRWETRRLQMLKYDEDLANTRPSTGRRNPVAPGSASISTSTTARTPDLTRTTNYAAGQDLTSTTNSKVPTVFESTTTAASTTSSSPVLDSPPSSLASEQESLSAYPARLSKTEQKREEMNHLADRNVEDLMQRARAAARYRSPSGSDESDGDSGQESQSAVKRRQIVDEDDDDEEEDEEYEQQQKQQDDNNTVEGSSSGRCRKNPQELQLERDEAFAREPQDAEGSQRLSTQDEIDENTVQQLQRSEGQRAAAGVTGAGTGAGHTMTLEEQRLENDMAMAKRMQQEENDDEPQSDSKPNSVVRRKRSLRIIAQKERLLSSTSESTTPAAPTSRPKKTVTSTRSTPSVAKQKQQRPQKQQKPTRNPTRQLAARSSASSNTPVQASSPSIQSAVETSPPPFSLPSPMLSSTTRPRRITISSLLTTSSTPSPTGWDFPSPARSSSRSPTRVHSSLYTPYNRPGAPQQSRTGPPPTRPTRSSSPRDQHSQRSSPPRAGAEFQSQSSERSPQPERSEEGLNLLADACEKAVFLPSSTLSTLLSTPATAQVHQHHSTTGALAGESTTATTTKTTTTATNTNTTPTYTSNQLSPHAEPGSSTATTVQAIPAENGTGSPSEDAPFRTSRRSQRIQERGMNESVSKHLAEEKAKKKMEEEERKAKEAKTKGRKPRAVKEENKKEDVKEATKKGRKPRATKEEAKEETEEVKPKGRKRKATGEASLEDVVVTKSRKPKAAKEEETEEDTKEEVTVVKKGRKPKTVTEDKKEETEEAKPKGRKRKATEEAREEEGAEVKKIRKPRAPKKDTQEEDKAKDEKGKGKKAKK